MKISFMKIGSNVMIAKNGGKLHKKLYGKSYKRKIKFVALIFLVVPAKLLKRDGNNKDTYLSVMYEGLNRLNIDTKIHFYDFL